MSALVLSTSNWFSSMAQRFRWAWLAFQAPSFSPVVKLDHGVELDLVNRRIVVPGEFHLHAEGNLRLTSDKHVIVRSGAQDTAERTGFIFMNTPEDAWGNPIIQEIVVPEEGDHDHDHESH